MSKQQTLIDENELHPYSEYLGKTVRLSEDHPGWPRSIGKVVKLTYFLKMPSMEVKIAGTNHVTGVLFDEQAEILD